MLSKLELPVIAFVSLLLAFNTTYAVHEIFCWNNFCGLFSSATAHFIQVSYCVVIYTETLMN